MPRKILLTGASGAVGSSVLQVMLEQGLHRVAVFDVDTKRARTLFGKHKSRVDVIYGDLGNQDEVRQACVDKDIVIHLGAVIPPKADDEPELAYRVNTQGTQYLTEALEELSPEAFLIYASSVSVYGDRLENPNICTTDALTPSVGDEYARTKIAAEAIVQESRLNSTIFRLSAIMGSNNHQVGKLMFHMPLATPMEITTPEDAARAFVHAVDHSQQLNHKVFNLGGGAKCRIVYKDLLSKAFEISGLGRVDFSECAFAEKNFHCGYYADGDELEKLVHFRQDRLDDYFRKLEEGTTFFAKALARMFRRQIKRTLQRKSEPLNAIRNNDTELIGRFFGNSARISPTGDRVER